jgi:hypothetical protein
MFKPNHSCSNSRSFDRRPNFTLNAHGNEAKNALGSFMAQAPKSRKRHYGTNREKFLWSGRTRFRCAGDERGFEI